MLSIGGVSVWPWFAIVGTLLKPLLRYRNKPWLQLERAISSIMLWFTILLYYLGCDIMRRYTVGAFPPLLWNSLPLILWFIFQALLSPESTYSVQSLCSSCHLLTVWAPAQRNQVTVNISLLMRKNVDMLILLNIFLRLYLVYEKETRLINLYSPDFCIQIVSISVT